MGRVSEEAEYQAALRYDEGRSRLADVRQTLTEAYQAAPARAFTTAMTQVLMNSLGGRLDILARGKEVEKLLGRAQTFQNRAERATGARLTAQEEFARVRNTPGSTPEEIEDARQGFLAARTRERQRMRQAAEYERQARIAAVGQDEYIRQFELERGRAMTASEKAATAKSTDLVRGIKLGNGEEFGEQGAVTRGQRVRALAVGGVSSLVGGALFGIGLTAASAAFNVAIEGMAKVAENAADSVSGFALTAKAVTAQLAQLERGNNYPGTASQLRFAQLGITPQEAATVYAPAAGQARLLAGLQGQLERTDLRRTAAFYSNQIAANGAIPGLGGDLYNGLLPNTPLGFIGQTPSAREQLMGEVNRLTFPLGFEGGLRGAGFPAWASALGGDISKFLIPSSAPTTAADLQNQIAGTVAQRGFFSEQAAISQRGLAAAGQAGAAQLMLSPSGALSVEGDMTIKAFSDAGAQDLGEAIVKSGYVLSGAGGGAPDRAAANAFLAGWAQGGNLQDANTTFRSALPQLRMQQATNFIQADFQRNRVLPLQFGWQQFLNRPLAPGVGVLGGAGARPELADLRSQLDTLAGPGLLKIKAQLPPELFAQLDKVSGQLKDWQEQNITLHVNLANAQWNEQLRVAREDLGDLLALANMGTQQVGTETVAVGRLGQLQRSQYDLTRQSQQLELEHNQRSINFNKALAQIHVEGTTPAEMFQRAKYAEAEAAYAQQQQTISVKQFGIGGLIDEEQFRRQAQRALNQFDLMLEGHKVEIDDSQLQDLLPTAKAVQDELGALGATYTDSILANEQAELDLRKQISVQTNSWVEGLEKGAAWLDYINGKGPMPTGTAQYGSNGVPLPGAGGVIPQGSRASGDLFLTNGPMRLTVGDAGGEMVAVLRNPKTMDLGYSGPNSSGMMQPVININFINPQVRDDRDLDTLARKVEQVMNRRALAVGLSV